MKNLLYSTHFVESDHLRLCRVCIHIVNSINTRPKFSSVLEVNDPSMPCENRNFPMNRFFYKPVDDRVQHRKKIPTTRHYFQAVKKSVIKYMQTENIFQSGQQQGCICIFFSTFRKLISTLLGLLIFFYRNWKLNNLDVFWNCDFESLFFFCLVDKFRFHFVDVCL